MFALKCLRKQLCADAEQFMIGAEDLVHETAILASLDHRHIIKVRGRAAGPLAEAFGRNAGYCILLDKLHETLHERIGVWRRLPQGANGPNAPRLEVARAVAAALTYLHTKGVVFRDLKPPNVGFDGRGVVKLFDFGFAAGLPLKDAANPAGLLFDKCGTIRYMAPEVGFSSGYGTLSDVYSFGVFFWELCSLEKPFACITSEADFYRDVFVGGQRPELGRRWPAAVRDLIRSCWSTEPGTRPSMIDVESSLSPLISDISLSK